MSFTKAFLELDSSIIGFALPYPDHILLQLLDRRSHHWNIVYSAWFVSESPPALPPALTVELTSGLRPEVPDVRSVGLCVMLQPDLPAVCHTTHILPPSAGGGVL